MVINVFKYKCETIVKINVWNRSNSQLDAKYRGRNIFAAKGG